MMARPPARSRGAPRDPSSDLNTPRPLPPRRPGSPLAPRLVRWLPAALLGGVTAVGLRAQSDIDLTGYALTFSDEFDALSVTAANPKGAATWYFAPPYGAAGEYSDSIWDTAAFSVTNGILADRAWIVHGEDRAGSYCGGPLGMKDGAGDALVTTVTPGAKVNGHAGFQWDGYVGMRFTTGPGGLTLKQLGRYVLSGNSQTHDLILLDGASGDPVTNGVTTVATAGATPGTFAYGDLPATVTLEPNHAYSVLSHEGNGGSADAWYAGAGTLVGTTAALSVDAGEWGEWHSGNLSSVDPGHHGFAQRYGYFEIRCRMPDSGNGAWPAFWLQPNNFGTATNHLEIDIFEWYGVSHSNVPGLISEATHNWPGSEANPPSEPTLYAPQTVMPHGAQPWAGYHIYGCQVDPVHVTWYIDGVRANQIPTATAYVTAPFYIMIDYALGGGWPLKGMVNNSHFDIDWVRVYQLPAPALTPQLSGDALTLTWPYGTLEESANPPGPWTTVTNATATSYRTTLSPTQPRQFFRVVIPP